MADDIGVTLASDNRDEHCTINPVDAGYHLDMLCDAVAVVVKAGYAHQDLMQRRVRVGFATAGWLLILLEDAGVIGPVVQGSKRRQVLVSPERLTEALALLRGEEVSA